MGQNDVTQRNEAHQSITSGVNRLKMSSDGPNLPDYRHEDVRLATFVNWPAGAKVEARKVARAGLYFTGQYAEAKCPWCEGVITTWDYGDQAMARHRLMSPNCQFVLGRSDNIPLLRMTPSPTPTSSTRATATTENDEGMDVGDGGPDQESQPDFESHPLKRESERFKTFDHRWPHPHIRPADLAASGFIYIGPGDLVKCVFCNGYVGQWDAEDFPQTEHRSLYPLCPFVQGRDVGNVPIEFTYNPFSSADEGSDEAGIRENPPREVSNGPERGVLRLVDGKGKVQPPEVGIISHSGPANPKYCTLEARLKTFTDWLPGLRQQPPELADAGFFYIGSHDRVKCFYCDGGLMNWQQDDDPWTEHARWFSQCGFLRLVKGDEFIAKCLGQKPPEEIPGLPSSLDKPSVTSEFIDEQFEQMLSSPLVHQVIVVGVDIMKVKSALKKKLEATGTGFKNAHDLSEAALLEQLDVEKPIKEEQDRKIQTTGGACAFPQSEDEQLSTSSSAPNREEVIKSQPITEKEKGLYRPPSPEDVEASSSGQEKSNDIDLKSENQRLKEQRKCKICFDEEIGVVFLPCGHFNCCVKCAPSLKQCPFCRQSIQATVRTFMS